MKKLCLFVSISLIGAAAMAQTQTTLGIKAGLNVANVSVQPQDFQKASLMGFHGGLLAHIHVSPELGIQPEVLYSGQGFKDESNGTDWKLNYVNVPVMVQYMFDNGFRIEAGPQVGFLLDGKVDAKDGHPLDVSNDLKKVDASMGVGLGYLTYSGLGIEGRYNIGLTNINKDPYGNKIQNRVFQVGLFYMLNNNHKAMSR